MMGLEKYAKVRLSDKNGENGETCWAYAERTNKNDFTASNLRLILDSNSDYFEVGTELILKDDGFNVDMEATQELLEVKKLLTSITVGLLNIPQPQKRQED